MLLRRFLNFVWRAMGPQGALLYTALLLIRRVESSADSYKAFDFMARFSAENGPNVSASSLNATCDPFYPMPSSFSSIQKFLQTNALSRQFHNSTANARLLIGFWTRFFPSSSEMTLEKRLAKLCAFLLEQEPRLRVCQLVADQRPSSAPKELTNARCVHVFVQAGRNKSTVRRECRKEHLKIFDGTHLDVKTPMITWSNITVFFCDKLVAQNRRWLIRVDLPILNRRRQRTGVARLMFSLRDFRLNQCEIEQNPCANFAANCIYKLRPNAPIFSLGNYVCECTNRFEPMASNGTDIEAYLRNTSKWRKASADSGIEQDAAFASSPFFCNQCPLNCQQCEMDGRCEVRLNFRTMRDFPLGVQSFCITVCLVIMGIVFKIRRKRVIKTSGWALLEIFIFGAVLLYATVVVMYFKPTKQTCLLLPWLREVGFSITYGTLIVKVYRVLSGFQSRKAHRVCVRDKDVLRYILGIFVAVVAYMGAWTAVNFDHLTSNDQSRMIENGVTPEGFNFTVCRAGIWCGVAEASELLFLCWGLYYCHCVRSAPSEYSELRFITVSLIFETVVSLVLHIAHHFVWNSLHPDYAYILYFVRCHLTVTIAVILIIGPKLWYLHRPPSTQFGRTPALSHPDSHLVQPIKLNLTSNGEIDLGEINIADMDPEDIRRELKRLYTQMEIYKTKEMRKDNPHVSRRRGGRKQTHRRFSLQPFHHKHRSHQTSASVHEEEVSKVSDASNNSGDEGATSGERKTTS